MTNNTRLRFGQIETITVQGDTAYSDVETVHDYQTTVKMRHFVQNVFGESDKQVLTETLKLMDKLKDEDTIEIGFECTKKAKGSKYQMKVMWTVK